MQKIIRALTLLMTLLIFAFSAAQTSPTVSTDVSTQRYEVWALDQGTNRLYIISPDLEVVETIDFPEEVDMPHMIDFSSDYAYAFIASPASGNTTVMRTADRQIVAILDTGAGTHMASVSRQDQVIVDVLGDIDRVPGELVEIVWSAEDESFEIGRRLIIQQDPLFADLAAAGHLGRPVCHDYSLDGRHAYITLGPALTDGVLVLFNTEDFVLERVYDSEEVRANCGTMLSPDGRHMFVNGGSLGEGHWYAIDTETLEVVHEASSQGTDAHGVYFDTEGLLWMVNRHSSNAIIIDPETFEIVEEIDFVGRSPDILTASPDGRYIFITLRGPIQRSGPHQIAGDTPGVAVIDAQTRELITIIQPDEGNEQSDFHGIGLRPLEND